MPASSKRKLQLEAARAAKRAQSHLAAGLPLYLSESEPEDDWKSDYTDGTEISDSESDESADSEMEYDAESVAPDQEYPELGFPTGKFRLHASRSVI